MALVSPALTTTVDMVELGRKVQGDVKWLVMRKTPEWALMGMFPGSDLPHSRREVTQAVFLDEQGGGAAIGEFGYEARDKTLPPDELSYSYMMLNSRFSVSGLARRLAAQDGKAFLQSQIRAQVMRDGQGFSKRFSQICYGLTSGLICQTSTNATTASQTLTLINAYGATDAASDTASFLASMFSVGDRIAIVRAGAILSNGIGEVTARSLVNGTISVTMVGSCDVDANDGIYFAESVLNDTSDLGSCDINKWTAGLTDARDTVSLYGLSSSSQPEWAATISSTSGRVNGTKVMAMQHAIENKGGSGPYVFIHSQGISRDIFNQQFAAVRFADPMSMRLDGDVKVAEGVTPFTSKYVPPGFACLAPKKAINKWPLGEWPNVETGKMPDFSDATEVDKVPDRDGHLVSNTMTWGNIIHRHHLAFLTNQTES